MTLASRGKGLSKSQRTTANLVQNSKTFQALAQVLSQQIVRRTRYWSMAGYVAVFLILVICTIVKFVWYDQAKSKKNKKQMETNLGHGILFLILSVLMLVYIIYLETLWGIIRS